MKLHVLVSDGGDGSYYPQYVLDPKVMERLEDMDARGTLPDGWSDGDGFHSDWINVPDDSTPESLGISVIKLEDLGSAEDFDDEEDDEEDC